MSKEWLSRKEAAYYLEKIGCPVSARTLRNWALHNNAGRGPPFTRIRQRIVVYSRTELERWGYSVAVRSM